MLRTLDIIIGLAAVYTAFSLLASWWQEQIAGAFQLRASTLRTGLAQMIGDAKTHSDLYKQPSIASAQTPQQRDPSYLTANQFSMAVLSLLKVGTAIESNGATALSTIQNGVQGLSTSRLRSGLETLAGSTSGDVDRFVAGIEKWFNDEMDRVGGWYRRKTQIILVVLGFTIAALFNVDTIRIAQGFVSAPLTMSQQQFSGLPATAQQYVSDTVFANLPWGWPDRPHCNQLPAQKAAAKAGAAVCTEPDKRLSLFLKVVGLLLTGIALSFGAPFWFDTLQRFVNVRNAGPPPATAAQK